MVSAMMLRPTYRRTTTRGLAVTLRGAVLGSVVVSAVLAPVTSAGAADPAPTVRQVTAGAKHSCALDTTGAVFCWGDNSRGQLGAEAPGQSSVPVKIALSGPAVSIASGDNHTCAVVATEVLCWGSNTRHQLGNYKVPTIGAVVRVDDLEGITPTTVVAGVDSSCTVTADRDLYCWGETANQLGNLGWTTKVDVPGDVTGADVEKWYGCAATTEGPYCWSVMYKGFQRAPGFPAGEALALTASHNATCAQATDTTAP
jgi:alpha-tubulin suppressor-like RCC1 family protein